MTDELVRNTYTLPQWQIGIQMADGAIAVDPGAQKYTEHDARRIAADMQARKPFVARAAINTAAHGGQHDGDVKQ